MSDLEFEHGDKVYLKISKQKGVIRFFMIWKLNPRYMGPYEILERVGKVSYHLKIPNEEVPVQILHSHVMMLRNEKVVSLIVCWKNHLV